MAEIPAGEYLHRSIDQLRSMNERGTLSNVLTTFVTHDYKPVNGEIKHHVGTDYTIKVNINNNNLIDNRNTSAHSTNLNNQSPDLEQKHHLHHQQHQQQYSSPSTPPTPLSITDAQMNDSKVKHKKLKIMSNCFSQLLLYTCEI